MSANTPMTKTSHTESLSAHRGRKCTAHRKGVDIQPYDGGVRTGSITQCTTGTWDSDPGWDRGTVNGTDLVQAYVLINRNNK